MWPRIAMASPSNPVPSVRAVAASTGPVKKIQACAPTPERETSSAALTPIARAALR